MKNLLLPGLVLALLSGAAFAQANGKPPAPPPPAAGQPPAPPSPDAAPPPPGGPDASADAPDAPPPPPSPGGTRGQRPPPPPRGAHFRLQRGDTLIDVKCADDEPMKACADIVFQMVDRLQVSAKP